jgi:DNA transposition AAA+ family ATPase
MDNVNKQKIKDFLDNTALFYSLVKNKDENQQSLESIIELLKIQHSMNKHALMSLGVSFDDTNKIREMNQRIRQLESELAQNGDVNFKKANQFIYFEQTKLQDYLDEKGIFCSVEFIMTSNLKVSIHIYDRDVNYKPSYAENDDEAAQLIEDNNKKNEAFKNNFDLLTVNNKNDEPINYYLLFSNKNIEKLETMFNDYFNSRISQIEYEVKIKNDGMTIHDYNFSITNLDSSQLFSQAITKD